MKRNKKPIEYGDWVFGKYGNNSSYSFRIAGFQLSLHIDQDSSDPNATLKILKKHKIKIDYKKLPFECQNLFLHHMYKTVSTQWEIDEISEKKLYVNILDMVIRFFSLKPLTKEIRTRKKVVLENKFFPDKCLRPKLLRHYHHISLPVIYGD